MQTDTISRLQNMSSIVKTPSPLGVQQQQQQQQQQQRVSSNNTGQLDNIFNSVKRQIDQWGENAKWKIDLVLLDNPQEQQQQQQLHPLLSPQHLHPNAITTPSNSNATMSLHCGDSIASLPVTSSIEYPWDYVAPSTNDWRQNSDDLQQKLRESIERQKYLEGVIWSQAEQIKHSPHIPDKDHAINTMKSIFLMSQNEQRTHYSLETNLLHKEIETLSKKLQKMASLLYDIENMELPPEDVQLDKDTLLSDRRLLIRKIHLAELRLSARDAEIDYLHEVLNSLKSSNTVSSPFLNNTTTSSTTSPKQSSSFGKKLRKGPPYLFQQQYSPRSSEVRSSEQHPLSGLDSLGIVADQMLSDPEFETCSSSTRGIISNEKRLRTRLDDRRSQRSIDSAATLLAMPQLMGPQRTPKGNFLVVLIVLLTCTKHSFLLLLEEQPSESPEAPPRQPFDHNIPKKPRSTYTRWTEAEDALLRKAVKKYGHSNWEACSKDVQGRSNIQCRNRWIRHLEHRIVDDPEDAEEEKESTPTPPPPPPPPASAPATAAPPKHKQNNSPNTTNNARQSPSIASLLNNSNDDQAYNYSPRTTPNQLYDSSSSSTYHIHPNYRPPSPMATPKGGKRRAPEESPSQQPNKW
ncbi:hypothetical protein HPULCUR_009716 [Helicostylum pulchrum]|uniref:Uncharacterized protein n=1 Tax=Helicostylum pulchrum TaxID=562976 RepID=A0ABP9YB92_9FUNG